MKEMFGKGFGFMMGWYAACIAMQTLEKLSPDKYKTNNKTEVKTMTGEEA